MPRARLNRGVNGKKIVSAQLMAFPCDSRNQEKPVLLGNAVPLVPLADTGSIEAKVGCHFGDRGPKSENRVEGSETWRAKLLHVGLIERDNLSRQSRTTRPVTRSVGPGKLLHMGKATTPTKFKTEFCQRLKAARIMAGLEQADFAKALGLLPNTYNKYETRSLLPHYLIPLACELLEIDPKYLYYGEKVLRKTG
jgi:DNA-binding XRE family transcriptional regulator